MINVCLNEKSGWNERYSDKNGLASPITMLREIIEKDLTLKETIFHLSAHDFEKFFI